MKDVTEELMKMFEQKEITLHGDEFCKVLKKEDAMLIAAEIWKHQWRDVDEELPVDNKHILLSFSNFTLPMIGRYEEDADGGAFYLGDELQTCSSQELFVNAWMPLPDPYRPE